MTGYTTLGGVGTANLIEKKSEFIGNASPVTTEAAALEFIAKIKSQYSDAKHNVYAYSLRDNNTARFTDDGEPHGTAGLPVLDVLRKAGIVDAVIVVTRYFGGVLLGTGGLVRAYSKAASMAVEQAQIKLIECLAKVSITLSYPDFAKCEPMLADYPCRLIDKQFGTGVTATLLMRGDDAIKLREALREATAARAAFNDLGTEYNTI